VIAQAEHLLSRLGNWLVHADLGLSLLLLVGLSISLAHIFALLANRLSVRQILWQWVLDGLVLSLAFLLCYLSDMVLLSLYASKPVHPAQFLNGAGACLVPALAYIFVAAPYIGDLIATVIWSFVHLNVITFLHARFGLGYGEALVLTTPGLVLALVLLWIEFRQIWRAAYSKLASEVSL
jgi:hypothetical protein